MSIFGKGTETYLYLNGITPLERVDLSDGVVLLPASCKPNPDDIIAKSRSEIDIGVACVFLRSVSACLRITADSPKELAFKTWNSQWDAILLSALLDCEISFNFQADVPPENFVEAKDFHVTNYAFKGLNRGKLKKVTPAKQRWITDHYKSAKVLMDEDRYSDAVHCLWSYRWHSIPRAQLALLWSGIEGLFGVNNELSFRLSLYAARFLSPRSRTRQKAIFSSTKKLYSVRSKAVHGGKLEDTSQSVERSVDLLRELVMKCAMRESLPKTDELAP
ncbi:MAG: hypothetical protein H7Y43_10000 [Akkermansiaceae bacterium]|nr:hypothetical protein [Verrucomicrobiales bacterium]